MGLIDQLLASAVAVIAGLLGFGMLFSGAVYTSSNETVGVIVALVGIVLLVFAKRV